ncbi:hypothetical protein Srubr_08440 [Streptomyces rubradiris]|uniref:Uncharacterized protein n=1 Tax=Streptomyces rubradiris TaxID=285531 RepID=A0ABQ3R5A0_STRRR|nr:hypothetical protein GCM10018792_67700 [Streptomyces rubradiris]GHI50998.1 hypothetical protein Srubr_08440 [Streptomyces rubradiris]
MHFSWEPSGYGWATCRIWDGSTKHRDSVSYCTNALADLLEGVTGLYGPHGTQRFSFDLEPAEARWILRRRNSDVHNQRGLTAQTKAEPKPPLARRASHRWGPVLRAVWRVDSSGR